MSEESLSVDTTLGRALVLLYNVGLVGVVLVGGLFHVLFYLFASTWALALIIPAIEAAAERDGPTPGAGSGSRE